MTQITYPNQRLVHIHREKIHSDFLGIKNANWQAAARDLGAHSFLLYTYLASNAEGFKLALSPKAIRETIGMPPQTYRDQFANLISKGYIVPKKGNQFDFYEVPIYEARFKKPNTESVPNPQNNTTLVLEKPQIVLPETANNREINNNNKIIQDNNWINTGTRKEQVPFSPHTFEINGFIF